MEITPSDLVKQKVDKYTRSCALSMAIELHSLPSYECSVLDASIKKIGYLSKSWVRTNLPNFDASDRVVLISMSVWYVDTEVFDLSQPDNLFSDGGCVLYPLESLTDPNHGIFHDPMGREDPILAWVSFSEDEHYEEPQPSEDAYKALADWIHEQFAYEPYKLVEWYDYEVPELTDVHPIVRNKIRELVEANL